MGDVYFNYQPPDPQNNSFFSYNGECTSCTHNCLLDCPIMKEIEEDKSDIESKENGK